MVGVAIFQRPFKRSLLSFYPSYLTYIHIYIYGWNWTAGRKALTLEEKRKLGGGYNSLLQTSLPDKFRCYNPAEETADSSHRAFTTAFPRGFALEVIHVYSGPPVIVYKFRHWGYMEGPFKGHEPTGEMVQLFGMAIFEVWNFPSHSWL